MLNGKKWDDDREVCLMTVKKTTEQSHSRGALHAPRTHFPRAAQPAIEIVVAEERKRIAALNATWDLSNLFTFKLYKTVLGRGSLQTTTQNKVMINHQSNDGYVDGVSFANLC